MADNNEELIDEIITGRRAVYGDPEETFKEHAIVWSVIFGVEVRPDQVALALVAYKMLRANRTPDYSDNIDDVIGYADIFKKVQGDRMIDARSVDDYLQQKKLRDEGVLDFFEAENSKSLGLEFFRAESADEIREQVGIGNATRGYIKPRHRFESLFGPAPQLTDEEIVRRLRDFDAERTEHLPERGCCGSNVD